MKVLIFLIQAIDVEEKLKNAPDDGYQMGLLIGSFIPFILLVGIAYWMYYTAKKREKNE